MWELFMQMLAGDAQKDGFGQNQTSINPSGVSPTAPKSQEATVEMAEQGIAPKIEAPMTTTMGNMAGNVATGLLSPYTRGIEGAKALYENPGDKQALGSVLNMLSPTKPTQTESNMPSMTSGNLGLPSSGMQGPMMPNLQSKRNGLANQAFGRYY
jgi:hypothetical protein